MKKYIKYAVTSILILLSLSSIFIGRYILIDILSITTNEDIISYLTEAEGLAVYAPDVDVYYELDNSSTDSYKIPKGTEIEIVQPLMINEETKRIPIMISDNGERKQVFIKKHDILSKTSSNNEVFYIKLYKKLVYATQGIMDSRRGIIITLIISVLLMFGDLIVDPILKSFDKVDDFVPMSSLVIPSVVYIIINLIIAAFDEKKYTQLLKDGLVLLPKDDAFISWATYLVTAIFIISIFLRICKLYLNYNPIIAVLKFIIAFMLTYIFSIASVYALIYTIGITIVLGGLSGALSIATSRRIVITET